MYVYRNPHAHILTTLRPMDGQGRWEAKSQVEYLCKKGKEAKPFTASEYASAKLEEKKSIEARNAP